MDRINAALEVVKGFGWLVAMLVAGVAAWLTRGFDIRRLKESDQRLEKRVEKLESKQSEADEIKERLGKMETDISWIRSHLNRD